MHIVPLSAVRHALRRSRLRKDILLALLRLVEASLADLVGGVGSEVAYVRGALRGDDKNYRRVDSLIALGLVVETGFGREARFSLTRRGRWVARAARRELLRRGWSRRRAGIVAI